MAAIDEIYRYLNEIAPFSINSKSKMVKGL